MRTNKKSIKVGIRDFRNINRIHSWLKIKSEFNGCLYRDGKCVGYKDGDSNDTEGSCHLVFHFFEETTD